jgi:hypothetical protein
MNLRAVTVGALLVALSMRAGVGTASPPKSRDEEEKLSSKLQHEQNPIKKAKLETQLGRLKLEQAFSAYDQGHFDQCWKLFDVYLAHMNSAWADLEASGHEAAKKPDGFKQLDIALRESRRDLGDFETHITFEERQAAEKITAQTVELRNRVLNVLFPGAAPKKKKGSLAGHGPPDFEAGKGPK